MSDIRLRHNQDEQSEAFLCKDINGAESYLHWMVGDKHVNPLVQQDRADLLDCIAELEHDIDQYREIDQDHLKRIEVLEEELTQERKDLHEAWDLYQAAKAKLDAVQATIKRIRDVGFDVHPSWGSSDDFYRGWRACRKQIEEALGEAK